MDKLLEENWLVTIGKLDANRRTGKTVKTSPQRSFLEKKTQRKEYKSRVS